MAGTTRLVQLEHPLHGRRAALVDGEDLHLLATYRSLYQFTEATLETGYPLRDLLSTDLSGITLNYAEVWSLETDWRFLPSFDHPTEPARCILSGCSPDWFYKGAGTSLFGHGEPLPVLDLATGAAEQSTIAAVYVIDKHRTPRRVGLTPGNTLADPAEPQESALYPCSIGPELWVEAQFEEVRGSMTIRRGPDRLWSGDLVLGERNSVRPLQEIESLLFRHAAHRRPGDVHILFPSMSRFSLHGGVQLQVDDEMSASWEGFGRPLVNRVGPSLPLLPSRAIPL